MANSFVQRVAEDLLHLEVNTIIKSQMSGTKMPDTSREALFDIARTYHYGLIELGHEIDPTMKNGFRGEQQWEFGGLMSFLELRQRASDGIKLVDKLIENRELEASNLVQSKKKMLDRIRTNTHRIVGMFEKHAEKAKVTPEQMTALKNSDPKQSNKATETWNNDVDRSVINKADSDKTDLKLDLKELVMIKKTWDIGMEEIVMQTIVGIDGDVTTRILERFAKNPDQTILDTHDGAVKTSIGFWFKIVDVVVKVGSSAFSSLIK
jgi:hypothetical protein